MTNAEVKDYIKTSISVKEKLLADEKTLDTIQKVAEIIAEAYKSGNKVLTAGNGGSAADAQHIAGEFVGKFLKDRKGLSAYSLTTNSSILTAVCNDFGFDYAFARQIEAIGQKGDVLIAISTSGSSQNVINAIEIAKKKDIITVGLTGQNECTMDEICDYIIKIPSNETPFIQESHIMVGHIICSLVEKMLF